MLVLGGGGYISENAAKCWTLSTLAIHLDQNEQNTDSADPSPSTNTLNSLQVLTNIMVLLLTMKFINFTDRYPMIVLIGLFMDQNTHYKYQQPISKMKMIPNIYTMF